MMKLQSLRNIILVITNMAADNSKHYSDNEVRGFVNGLYKADEPTLLMLINLYQEVYRNSNLEATPVPTLTQRLESARMYLKGLQLKNVQIYTIMSSAGISPATWVGWMDKGWVDSFNESDKHSLIIEAKKLGFV